MFLVVDNLPKVEYSVIVPRNKLYGGDNMINFSVAQARRFSGKTQKEMAKELGICVDTYRKIESRPREAAIWQGKEISRITGIPLDQICFD